MGEVDRVLRTFFLDRATDRLLQGACVRGQTWDQLVPDLIREALALRALKELKRIEKKTKKKKAKIDG